MKNVTGVSASGPAIWHGRPVAGAVTPRRDGLEVLLVDRGVVDLQVAVVTARLGVGKLAAFWALAPHQLCVVETATLLYRVTVPVPDFLQWQLPRGFIQQLLGGNVVLDESADPQSDRALFKQWLADGADGSPEGRKILALELEARLRRLARTMTRSPAAECRGASGVAAAELDHAMVMGRFIAEHYTEALHDADIARAAKLNAQYAIRLFSRAFGVSMHRHLNDYRIAHARRLLATTQSKVIDVALESGFGSQSRFYESFTRACGQCPNEYRAALRRAQSS